MVEKAKIFYFSVFVLVVFAFIFHVTAMGYNHWKKATVINSTAIPDFTYTTIGLFTRCITSNTNKTETCFPNLYPGNGSCSWSQCLLRSGNADCQCDFLPSTKGIASCAIIAAVFLGLAIIILFIHSIKTSETRSIGLFLGLFPLFLLFFAFVFILIALILVGSYLSRDMMSTFQTSPNLDLAQLRVATQNVYQIRVDWATGLEIIALVFTFFSFLLYNLFVFKLGRSA